MIAVPEVVMHSARVIAANNTRLLLPSGAEGECYLMSTRLELSLKHAGVMARTVRMIAVDHDHEIDHCAVLVNGVTIIDLTARQFDPTADVPLVMGLFNWMGHVCKWLPEVDLWDLTYESEGYHAR
jgi:hypothetical protein